MAVLHHGFALGVPSLDQSAGVVGSRQTFGYTKPTET